MDFNKVVIASLMSRKKGQAFTLIELLVVVAVVGIITTLALASYLPAVQQSRDKIRKGDIEKIRAALALYYSNNDEYPPAPLPAEGQPIKDKRGNIYLNSMPVDPKTGKPYEYYTNDKRYCYWVKADLETGDCYVEVGGDETECPHSCGKPVKTSSDGCWRSSLG